MKRAVFVLITLLFLNIFTFSIVSAQDETNLPGLPVSEDQINKAGEFIDTATTEPEYLKQEWKKFLGENKFGQILLKINDFIEKLNPVIKPILGVDYSLTLLFFFALAIWIGLLVLIYPITSQLFDNKLFGFIASFAVVSLIGLSGVIRKAVDLLSTVLKNQWIAWVAFGVTIIIAVLLGALGGSIQENMKKSKDEEGKEQEKRDRETLHTVSESQKRALED